MTRSKLCRGFATTTLTALIAVPGVLPFRGLPKIRTGFFEQPTSTVKVQLMTYEETYNVSIFSTNDYTVTRDHAEDIPPYWDSEDADHTTPNDFVELWYNEETDTWWLFWQDVFEGGMPWAFFTKTGSNPEGEYTFYSAYPDATAFENLTPVVSAP